MELQKHWAALPPDQCLCPWEPRCGVLRPGCCCCCSWRHLQVGLASGPLFLSPSRPGTHTHTSTRMYTRAHIHIPFLYSELRNRLPSCLSSCYQGPQESHWSSSVSCPFPAPGQVSGSGLPDHLSQKAGAASEGRDVVIQYRWPGRWNWWGPFCPRVS